MDICTKNMFSIKITQSAKNKIKDLIRNNDGTIGIKVSLVRYGCAGISYKISLISGKEENYIYVKKYCFYVAIEKSNLEKLSDMKIDYIKKGFGEETFTFENEREVGKCGCGMSVKL